MTATVASAAIGAYNHAVIRRRFQERVLGFHFSNQRNRPIDARRRAIAETNAFLSWAMKNQEPMPRIPRRRMDRGGFTELLRRPNAATIVACWWAKALDRIRDH